MKKLLIKNYKKIILVILFFWFFLIFVRFLYISKTFADDLNLIVLNSYEKKLLYYGDIYPIYLKLESLTNENDCIYLYSKSDKSYFLLRYLLYPTGIYWADGPSGNIKSGNNRCNFLLFYNQKSENAQSLIDNYSKVVERAKDEKINNSEIYILK